MQVGAAAIIFVHVVFGTLAIRWGRKTLAGIKARSSLPAFPTQGATHPAFVELLPA